MDKKILVIIPHPSDSLKYTVIDENVKKTYAFADGGWIYRSCRRLSYYLNIPIASSFIKIKKEEIINKEIIILYQCLYPKDVIKKIREYNKECRIIYFCWGSVVDMRNTPLYKGQKYFRDLLIDRKKYNFEIWSFDKGDCDKYGLKYNNQMCGEFCVDNIKHKVDVFFRGYDKGRLSLLKELDKMLIERGISTDIAVIPMKRKKYRYDDKKYLLKRKEIPYYDFLCNELTGKVLLEIVQNGQNDITWRALEAMFYKRKLITNCSNIKNYEFYNKNNIFILGEDDIDNIKKFVNSPFADIPINKLERFKFRGWLENFDT